MATQQPPYSVLESDLDALPGIAVGVALLDFDGKTDEGQIVHTITPAWIYILRELRRDPLAFLKLDGRQTEELVAGGREKEGWKVILTPRSGDGGIDIISTRSDFGGLRIIEQVKRYKPGHLVPAEGVRAMWGVLDRHEAASKAVISTTSDFAPGVFEEFKDVTPTRLELRNWLQLREWLIQVFGSKQPAGLGAAARPDEWHS
jgi:restriction system protein